MAVDLGGGAHLLNHAVVHHHDAVRHRQRLFLVVGDHDGGDAEPALQGLHLVAQACPYLRVEGRERLVEQQQPGRHRDGAGERDALLLPARQLCGVLVPLVGKADEIEQLPHPVPDLGARAPLAFQPVGDVARHRHVREQGVGLEHDPEVAFGGRKRRDVRARLFHGPRALDVEPGNRPQQGGLAASRGAEKAYELAFQDIERDVGQRGELAELLRQAPDSQIGIVGRGVC